MVAFGCISLLIMWTSVFFVSPCWLTGMGKYMVDTSERPAMKWAFLVELE